MGFYRDGGEEDANGDGWVEGAMVAGPFACVVLKDVDVEVKQGIPAPEERSGPAGTIETA